jgi:Methane oxygenase PmoA
MFLKPIVFGVACAALAASAVAADGRVRISEKEDRLRVEIDGELFTEYRFKGAPHVYFYPLMGPGGVHMTRHYPMQRDSEGEQHDHEHHRSLWYSHGAVNGVDFWAEAPKAGKIVHDKFLDVKSGTDSAVIRSANKWVAPDGSVTCTDERVFRVYARPKNERLFDFEITLVAGDKEVVLGDTKEGTMAIRLAETMRLTPNKFNAGKTNGHIVQSTGVRDKDTWGKQAEWCDYHGPVGDKILGVAIFDHPSNPRHPTWWHVRDYGLFAANPFGLHDFEKKPAGTGDLKIAPGKSVTFKYRFYIHEGDEQQGKVAERYAEYAGKKSQ